MRGLGDLISHKSVKGSRQKSGPFTVRLTLGTVSHEKTAVLLDFLQIITEYCRALQVITDYYRVLQNIT